MVLATSASAHAAETLTLTFGADPTEEVPIPVTATWTSADPDPRVIVTIKPDGPLGCGSAYNVDDPSSSDVIYTTGSSSGTTTQNWTINDPGTSILCGYLQNTAGDSTPLAVTGAVRLAVRSARATVSIQVPPRVDAGQVFALSAPVSTELSRRLIVTLKPAGGRGCEATYALDDPNSSDAIYTTVQGSQTGTANVTASSTNGTYLLCAYVVESAGDPAPEATASTTFLVGPDPCVTARAKLKSATKAVTTAEKAVTRYRKSYKAYEKKAKRAHGAKRASYKRLAKRDKSRYKSAVRTRSQKRSALSTAQAAVTAACGG